MAIKPAGKVDPFVEKVLTMPEPPIQGRFAGVVNGAPVARPSVRRVAGETAETSLLAVKALLTLAQGEANVRFVAGADPALCATIKTSGSKATELAYRLRDNVVVNTWLHQQPPMAAVLFAARLLLNRAPEFSKAYIEALAAVRDPSLVSDIEANERLTHATDELCVAIERDIDPDGSGDGRPVGWYAQADTTKSGEIDEVTDVNSLPLDPLFTDPKVMTLFSASKPLPADLAEIEVVAAKVVEVSPVGAQVAASEGKSASARKSSAIDPKGFVGPQLDVAIRFMAPGTRWHILHHGPTGTGKSFVWDLAMKAIDPAFDADQYSYFVHGSAGLEDIDFTGNYVLRPSGAREWVWGPLCRAMMDGKRFKVEELNRLPGPMLNVLLGAMDYGRINVPRFDSTINIVAQPGFAVDAMANIGREYTATDDIDPAIMRRFLIKIEYDFLKPAEKEVSLLLSRNPKLDTEDAQTLVRIANAVRDAYESGGGTDFDPDMYVSPAALLVSAALIADEGLPIPEAIELSWMVDVARTKDKRIGIRAMIDQNVRARLAKPRKKSK